MPSRSAYDCYGEYSFVDELTQEKSAATAQALFYDAHFFVCTNRRASGHARGSCAGAGSEELRDYMKARAKELRLPRVRINSAGCLDRCELGPCIVIYPQGTWYRVATRDDVDRVLDAHRTDQANAIADLALPLG